MIKDSFENFEETESLQDYNISEFDQISGIDTQENNQ